MTDFIQTLTNDLASIIVDDMRQEELREAAIRETVSDLEREPASHLLSMWADKHQSPHPDEAAWRKANQDFENKYQAMRKVANECDKRFKERDMTPVVTYSMDAKPLDKIFIDGPVTMYHDGWGEPYQEELVDPTLWDIVQFANRAIRMTGDSHHVFLEGLYPKEIDGKVMHCLSMGS